MAKIINRGIKIFEKTTKRIEDVENPTFNRYGSVGTGLFRRELDKG